MNFERPENKITMREVRENEVKRAAKWLADADKDIAELFKRSQTDAADLEKTDFEANTGNRNQFIGNLAKRSEAAEKLFARRKESLNEFLKAVGAYSGKDMKMLKEQLGMNAPADDEISTEISPSKRPISAGEEIG
jgi:hypothetical protein